MFDQRAKPPFYLQRLMSDEPVPPLREVPFEFKLRLYRVVQRVDETGVRHQTVKRVTYTADHFIRSKREVHRHVAGVVGFNYPGPLVHNMLPLKALQLQTCTSMQRYTGSRRNAGHSFQDAAEEGISGAGKRAISDFLWHG